MNEKLLITIEVPLLNESFDIFIPINKKIGTIKNYCLEVIQNITNNSITNPDTLRLYDKENSSIYDLNIYVKNSDIKNGTTLLLI